MQEFNKANYEISKNAATTGYLKKILISTSDS